MFSGDYHQIYYLVIIFITMRTSSVFLTGDGQEIRSIKIHNNVEKKILAIKKKKSDNII